MPAVSNASLIAGLADDIDATFPAFVRQFQDGIYSGVRRFVPSAPDAEDVTQETFVRAYQALQTYESERIGNMRLGPWLWTIALNLCRNAARTRARKPTPQPLDSSPEPPGGTDTAEMAVESATDEEWQTRLAALPAPLRAAVVLRHVVGLSYSEMAEALGRPEGTIKSDVHRGLKRLQAMLEEESEERS